MWDPCGLLSLSVLGFSLRLNCLNDFVLGKEFRLTFSLVEQISRQFLTDFRLGPLVAALEFFGFFASLELFEIFCFWKRILFHFFVGGTNFSLVSR